MQLIDIFSTRNILIYLFIINLVGFYMMWSDKRKAKWGKWRIPEQTLFIVTALGGGIGTIAGMYTFHHKTKHWYFVIGMPLILIVQVAASCYIYISYIAK